MQSLDVLRKELKAIGPKVSSVDKKILTALDEKEKAATALEQAKTKVRKLKAVRDPLREEQMLLQRIVGDLDPDTPESQTITRAELTKDGGE